MSAPDPTPLAARLLVREAVVRSVVHDLRNTAQLLGGVQDDPDLPPEVTRLLASAVTTLLQQLEHLDQIGGEASDTPAPLDVGATVRGLAGALGLLKPRRSFTLTLAIAEGLPAARTIPRLAHDALGLLLLAVRGPSLPLVGTQDARVTITDDGTHVVVEARAAAMSADDAAEQDRRAAWWAMLAALAPAAHATAELAPEAGHATLRFPAWGRSAPAADAA